MVRQRDPELDAAKAYWRDLPAGYSERALFWSWYTPRNFGDWITPWLHERMTGQVPRYCPIDETAVRDCIFGTGSILRHLRHPGHVTVWGSGIISRDDVFASPLQTLAVRGPHTRRRFLELGHPCPEVYGDPAVLLPLFFEPPVPERRKSFGVVPHFVDYSRIKKIGLPDECIVDVCGTVEQVVTDIVQFDCLFSSSLHGLIVAHAYGIPAVWIRSETEIMGDGVKFDDYYSSVGLVADCLELPNPTIKLLERNASRSSLPVLSRLQDDLLRTCPF